MSEEGSVCMRPDEFAEIARGTKLVPQAYLLGELARTRCDLRAALAECAGLRDAVAAFRRVERERVAFELAETA